MNLSRTLVCVAAMMACACATPDVTATPDVDGSEEALLQKPNYCTDARSCPVTAIACRRCPDGSFTCPEAECVDGRCVQHFPVCPPPIDKCAAIRCRAGFHCIDGGCVPDEPKVFCGGIAAFPCPGNGECVDDPSDSCDPKHGGADCSGMCVCPKENVCKPGSHWDASPKVCDCVPDQTKVFCGGIAGIRCPGAGTCVDDPDDSCDPKNGGADCGGMCICKAAGLCPVGSTWDSSPGVCACVGATCGGNVCGPDQYCCNASCGICAPRGGACIQIACGVTVD